MTTPDELRQHARGWRAAAVLARAQSAQLTESAALRWRSPAANLFRQHLDRHRRELGTLAQREDELAAMLERIAANRKQGAA